MLSYVNALFATLERELVQDPDDDARRNALLVHCSNAGVAHAGRQEYQAALPYFERAYALSPTLGVVRDNLSVTHARLAGELSAANDFLAAVRHFERAYSLNRQIGVAGGGYAAAGLEAALACFRAADYGTAGRHLARAQELDPAHGGPAGLASAMAMNLLARAATSEKHARLDEALAHCLQAQAIAPDQQPVKDALFALHNRLGMAAAGDGNWSGALAHFEQAAICRGAEFCTPEQAIAQASQAPPGTPPSSYLAWAGTLLRWLARCRRDDDAAGAARAAAALAALARTCHTRADVRVGLAIYRYLLAEGGNAGLVRQEYDALCKRIDKLQRRLQRNIATMDPGEVLYSPFTGHTGRPGAPYYATGQRLDAWGFANRRVPPAEKGGAFRVFILGDSTMFNGITGLDATVPALVQEMLHAQGWPEVEVYNFAIAGCTVRQALALLFNQLVDHAPDLVLINAGGVDSAIHKYFDPRPDYPMWGFLNEYLLDWSRQHVAQPDLKQESLIDGLTLHLVNQQNAAQGGALRQNEINVTQEFLRFLRKCEGFAHGYGLDILVTLQPLIVTKRAPTPRELATCTPAFFDELQGQYGRLRDAIVADGWTRPRPDSRFRFEDITDVFDETAEDIYHDHIHYYTPLGRQLVASRMAALLLPHLAASRARGSGTDLNHA